MRHLLLILTLLIAFCACRPTNPPAPASRYATEFTTGQIEYYGPYYASAGLGSDVWAIDLYSDSLRLSTSGYMEGSGTNLYLSDIFLPAADSCSTDAFLSDTAMVFLSDTTGLPGTFLPGRYFEGNFTGAYLLLIKEGQLAGYSLITSGSLSIYKKAKTFHITFRGKTADGKPYECIFDGTMRLQKAAPSAPRRSSLIHP